MDIFVNPFQLLFIWETYLKMKIDLNQGAYFQIGGELGKYNSLPINVLVKIAEDFQQLIMTLAHLEIDETELTSSENFEIELSDFKKGSAVPGFIFSPRKEKMIGEKWDIHRGIVNNKLEDILEVSNDGDYGKLIKMYPKPSERNKLVESLYNFVSDFGSSPIAVVNYDQVTNNFTPIFKISKFKHSVKRILMTDNVEIEQLHTESDIAVGKIKKIKNSKGKLTHRVLATYPSEISLQYAPTEIFTNEIRYKLRFPLRCLFEKEDDYYVIHSEVLGIGGTGSTEKEAENFFSEEFDFLYNKLNSLEDKKLTKYNQFIKTYLNQLVEKIEK